ncbi:glycine cleavage system protein GcvH [Lachnospiraceae bacterium ZAX-1]
MAKQYEVRPIPSYTDKDTWARVMPDGTVRFGISDYAQQMLGELMYVELPEIGDSARQGISFASVESSKAVSEVIAPLSGEIVAINEELIDDPGLVNRDPYDVGWFAAIKPSNLSDEKGNLLDAAGYKSLLSGKA